MAITEFPPTELADEDGLIGVGGDLEVESLLLAYRSGIFPWPADENLLLWFSPPQRALIFLDQLHLPRSLLKAKRKAPFEFRFNHNFKAVITACAEMTHRGEQRGTWITSDMLQAYCDLHRAGFAHSVEAYQNKKLVGGVYGVNIGRMFAAESAFYRAENASKLAFLELIAKLREHGVQWIDCQQLTPFSLTFGAREVSREQYLEMLTKALPGPQLKPGLAGTGT
jgi:leucyl/phenylalanyl-tRNA--protein transferase